MGIRTECGKICNVILIIILCGVGYGGVREWENEGSSGM